jgi:hypothetical protein
MATFPKRLLGGNLGDAANVARRIAAGEMETKRVHLGGWTHDT